MGRWGRGENNCFRPVAPPLIAITEVWNNVLSAEKFERSRGGAKFEFKFEAQTAATGDEVPDFQVGFIDGYKKSIVLHMFVTLVDELVSQTAP